MSSTLIETNIGACGDIWNAHRAGLPFGDWELRCALARIYGVSPYFLVDEQSGTALPGGQRGGTLTFFGGERFSECNRLLGSGEGAHELMNHAIKSHDIVRFLAWDCDPIKHVDPAHGNLDVPYNQYWVAAADIREEAHMASLPPSVAKEFSYLQRKFDFAPVVPGAWSSARDFIGKFIAMTSESFRRRNRPYALDDPHHKSAVMEICRAAHGRDALKMTEVVYRGTALGLCVIVDDMEAEEAVYLMNLYDSSPSDVSNGVTIAALNYAIGNKRRVNALRGAFTLKKKFGFKPEPAFAIVKDSSWRVQPQVDLDDAELLALYGRRFGQAAPDN